jgi:sialate O-acetylesterase
MKRNFFLTVLTILFSHLLSGQIFLPSFFSDKMVLQQQSEVRIWGKAQPNKNLTITNSWDKIKYTVIVNNDSTWYLKIKTPKASYIPQTIHLKQDKYSKTIDKILIGEVWLCSGQSNMQMPMQGYNSQPVADGLDAIMSSDNDAVRCFTVKMSYSLQQQSDVSGKWESASPFTTPTFTAAGYYFARRLEKTLKVPVGIINSSYGGTAIEVWLSKEIAKTFGFMNTVTNESEIVNPKREPSVMYNAMISPLIGYGMRGALWYQGEGSRLDYKKYPAYFSALHKDWEQRWGIGEFPIYTVQIAPYNYGDGKGVLMREVQEQIAETQPRTGIVILTDVGEKNIIHPANKEVVGDRLAYLALGRTYFPMQKDFNKTYFYYQSPVYQKIEVKDSIAILYFKYATRGLTSFGQSTEGLFEIAGEDRKFYPATATFPLNQRNVIEVMAHEVKKPVAVRYAFKDFVSGTVFSNQGFPLSSFRTDNWDL